MRYFMVLVGLTILAAFGGAPADAQVKAAKKEPLVEQVRKAIERGVSYLRQQQRTGGSWDDKVVNHPGGGSCLALLALLNCGVPPNDPVVTKGLDYLRTLRNPTTYVRSLQTMVFVEAGYNEDLGRVQRNVDHLIDIRLPRGGGRLDGWSYDYPGNPGARADNSNSQYAVLALYMGRVGGAKINSKIWEEIREFYTRTQGDDGGWSYAPLDRGAFRKDQTTLTMTTAGLSGLLIAGMELNKGREVLRPDGTADNCGVYKENEPVRRALSWVGSPARFRFEQPQRTFYNLYGIERAGRLSGLRFFESHDWYREGCQFLVRRQHLTENGGYWSEPNGWDAWQVVSTSFSLLFLSKGRTPVLISKLTHRPPGAADDLDWNNDRNDARHLVDFASKNLFKKLPLAWQIFDVRRAVDLQGGNRAPTEDDLLEVTSDLLQSPIVYFNGHKSPLRRFTDVEKDMLKRYIDNGGFILAEACCGSKAFDRGFRQLCEELWPDTPLEPLPAGHPIWGTHFPVAAGSFKLHGLQMGCKTVLVYSPEDLSCRWEANKHDGDGRLAFWLGANIVAYATGMEPPRPRLSRVDLANVKEDPRSVQRGYLKVLQLKHAGDWNPAPRAMPNLMAHLRDRAGLDVVLKAEALPVHFKGVMDFKFVYMHGRKEFHFDDNELANLRFSLENGGLLFADACCGKAPFDKSFREFIRQLLPKHKLEPIPSNDELYGAALNGEELTEKNIRCRREKGGEFRPMTPELEGVKINGRWAVIYSRYDIGCALERHSSSDCLAYNHESALRLAGAAVLYTLRP